MQKYSRSPLTFIISAFPQAFTQPWSIYQIKEVTFSVRGKLGFTSHLELPNGLRLEREIYFIISGALKLPTCIQHGFIAKTYGFIFVRDPKPEHSWATCPQGVSIWVDSWAYYPKFTPFTWVGSQAHIPLGSNYTLTYFLTFFIL